MLIYRPNDNRPVFTQIGGKAYSLAQMQRMQLNIPKWFAITADCFIDFLYESRDEYFRLINNYNEENRQKIVKIIEATHFSESTKQAIRKEMAETFSPMDLVSVRSSAVDEDVTKHSFSGMLDTFLYQKQDDEIFECIKKCYISCFSGRAMEYRAKHRMITPHIRMAVIIQEMINPDYAGVIHTSNTKTNDPDEMLISVVTGAGENLVSGKENSSDYIVNTKREIKHTNPQRKARLSDTDILKLYDTALQIENSYTPRTGRRIEFALKQGEVYILQTSPLAEYSHIDKNKSRVVLDNSVLSEDYHGLITPLTFTFARDIYAKSYKKTLESFHVSEDNIKRVNVSLNNIIAHYENRLYFNENHFQKIQALFPAYAQAKSVKISPRITNRLLKLSGLSRKFDTKTNRAIRPYRNSDFSGYSNEQLLELYKDLEADILDEYSTPIIHDIAVSAMYNTLLETAKMKMIFNSEGTVNELLGKLGNNEIATRNNELLRLVKEIRHDSSLYHMFKDSSIAELHDQLLKNKLIIFSKINNFINKYPSMAVDEFKFESISIHNDPDLLLNIIKQYLEYPQAINLDVHKNRSLEQKFLAHCKGNERARVNYFLRKTKLLISHRETLHYRRAQIFGVVRNIYLRIGQNLVDERIIRYPQDIFYLGKDEIASIIKRGNLTIDDIRNRIETRQKDREKHALNINYRRLYFYGSVDAQHAIPILDPQEAQTKNPARLLKGVAHGNQIITGTVKYINSIYDADIDDEIIMTKHADAAWTAIFPMAKAVIAEEGDALAHFAVATRETNTTLITNVRGLTQKVHNGDIVKIDGKRGTIEVTQSSLTAGQ